MKTKKKGIIIISVIAVVLIAAIVGIIALLSGDPKLDPLDTSGAVATATQNGDTIVFNPDGTYNIQGDVEIENVLFEYRMQGTYSVTDGVLELNESAPTVSVHSKFGGFDLPGDIKAEIVDGALTIHLEASNETSTFELAHFILGKETADKLGVTGVTSDDVEDDPTNPTDPSEPTTPTVTEPVLDADGALLTVESAGNKIAFFPDNTFKVVGSFTLSDEGLTVKYYFDLTDKYSVTDGTLSLPKDAVTLLNSDLFASYGYVDVETPSRCTAEIVDGLLELRFFVHIGDGEEEIAVFKIGKEDAEKIGVSGIDMDAAEEPDVSAPTGISATSNGITLSFYPSNNTFDLVGESKMGDTVLATYSLSAPGTYTIENNVLKLSNVTLVVVSDYAPGTFDITGDQIAVVVNEDGTLSVTFPIGEPPVVFTYTKEQKERIGMGS